MANEESKLIKYITIPSDLDIELPVSSCPHCNGPLPLGANGNEETHPKKMTHWEWFTHNVLTDPLLGKQADGKDAIDNIFFVADLRTAFKNTKAGDVVPVGKADWERVLKPIKNPTGGYRPIIAEQLTPYFRAWLDASDTDPRNLEASNA